MGYSRPADPQLRYTTSSLPSSLSSPTRRYFLMPHFSFWAWPLPQVGSFDRAAAAIDAIEAEHERRSGHNQHLKSKNPRAVWRGTPSYASAHQPDLRRNLLKVTRGKSWADVEALNETNALPIEAFCGYKYVLHTEGVAYSGRFQFLQLCKSVILTTPVLWMQHASHLLRPVFSDHLLGSSSNGLAEGDGGGSGHRGPLAGRTRRSWPVRYNSAEANIVFVKPNWSDLGETVAWLEAHPDLAEGIAARQRATFSGGGYFSPAAEVCYWRALLRGWSRVARVDENVWGHKEGVRFEIFSLTNQL